MSVPSSRAVATAFSTSDSASASGDRVPSTTAAINGVLLLALHASVSAPSAASARFRCQQVALCRRLLRMSEGRPDFSPIDFRDCSEMLSDRSLRHCPACGSGHMLLARRIEPSDTPALAHIS